MSIPILKSDRPKCQIVPSGTSDLCGRQAEWMLVWADICGGRQIPHNVCDKCRLILIKERLEEKIWVCPSHGREHPLAMVMREWSRIT